MDFEWTEEQKLLADAAKSFFSENCKIDLVKELMKGNSDNYLEELYRKIIDLGWVSLIYPEKYGGMDGTFLDLYPIFVEMGKYVPIGLFNPHTALAGTIFTEYGEDVLKEKYLPSICQGEKIVTFGFYEKDSSFDDKSIGMRAIKQGDEYIVSGKKIFVPYLDMVDAIIVAAKTGERKNDISLFVVDLNNDFIKKIPLKTMIGDHQFLAVFENVKIPLTNKIGIENEGLGIAEKLMSKIGIANCGLMIGAMEKVISMTVEYVKERKQFEQVIGSFQVIQHACVDMICIFEIAKIQTKLAAWKIANDIDYKKDVSMAKALCNDAALKIAKSSHQLHGAIGFTDEYDLHVFTKALRSWSIIYGTSEEHRKIVANEMNL